MMSSANPQPSIWRKHRFLLLRRLSQLLVLLTFVAGPITGYQILNGNLSASRLFDSIPLSDPLLTLQVLLSGHLPEFSLLFGALIIAGFYTLFGGRSFCSWVCPVNLITDAAAWLRRKLHLPRLPVLPRYLKYALLALVLLLPPLTGLLVWEWVNPVPLVYRALLFGTGSSLWLLVAIFLLDTFISERAWCGHLCPTGALYRLLGKASPLRLAANQPQSCDLCMACFTVCPEPQVLKPVLRGHEMKLTATDCTLCGRCIDVCNQNVFSFHSRLQLSPATTYSINSQPQTDTSPDRDPSRMEKHL